MIKLRHLLFLILSFCIAISVFSQSPLDSLIGKWQFVSKSGGKTGKIIYADPEVKKKIIEFTSDALYKVYQGDSLIYESKYQLIKSNSIYHRNKVYVINIDNYYMRQSFTINKNKLVLKEECYDCYGLIYTRVEPTKVEIVNEKCKYLN